MENMRTSSRIRWITYLVAIVTGVLVSQMNQVQCQIVNRAPHFIPGSGDMARFSLSENTPVGSPVYQLRGNDPEGGKLRFSISGPVFSVDRDTGVVRLRQELDRETQDIIEVIISITDEGLLGTEPNTVSLRREIPIRDYNDNPPTFIGRPYTAVVSESTLLGSTIDVRPDILVTDRDEGINAEIQLSCFQDGNSENDVCDTFRVTTEKLSEGNYTAGLTLLKQLDFETRPSYLITIMAQDTATTNQLTAYATVSVTVQDIQDQAPVFLNAPYSATIQENSPENTSVLTITAVDGDSGNPRPLLLTLENEDMGHFQLQPVGRPEEGKAILLTTNVPLDRESQKILQNGGVYTFDVRATELINNEVPADSSITQITIVVTDVNDHIPEFNQPIFNVSIPENLKFDTPLPGLSVYVFDKDMGINSQYNLSLRNVRNADNVFSVSPTRGEERTPVVVKVRDPSKLDYDVEDESLRTLEFDLIASVNGLELAITRVTVNLQDANDNSPIFSNSSYHVKVKENEKIDTRIANITAKDKDSGVFGKISYVLKGFGSENFYTDRNTGGLYVKKNLDYEQQVSYSLTIVAIDGGGRETNVNVFVDVMDVNDNYPIFESLEYTRTVREGATEFEPQFFVRATDDDGMTQGGGNVTYAIESDNSISGNVFTVNSVTGEIQMRRAANSMDTERGQYELVVSATDHGDPPLKNTTRVLIRVGISGNQRPVFKGHFRKIEKLPVVGPPSYRVSVPENAKPGYNVTMVTASDPDGLDELLRYRIIGANDNFVINEVTGLIQVSPQAHLDRDTNPDSFEIIVNAVDAGFPIPETATTTVYVTISDVNDKPPKFTQPNYVAFVSERSKIGDEVLKVTATDTDLDAELEYRIREPIKATTKAGVQINPGISYNPKNAFRIDSETGQIFVNGSLNHDMAAVIILTVEVKDLNATMNIEQQVAATEVTIYVQSFKDTNPVFRNAGWTSFNPVINVNIKEEMPIGSVLFTLEADDPANDKPINSFELIQPDSFGYFGLNDRTGDITLKKRLDYEVLDENHIELQVKANSADGQRSTLTKVNMTVENVNDNSPQFEFKIYKATLIENKKHPEKVVTVQATDDDASLTVEDMRIGFNRISYSIHGENSAWFEVNNTSGEIRVAPNQTVDRERSPTLKLTIRAEDSPGMPTESRQATADLVIEILDVNDNKPQFSQISYTAVIPENSAADSFVINIMATDPDEGPGGEVRYDFLNEGEVNGLFKINPTTGEIRTKIPLTGKGRSEPYEMVVRAQDNGGQVIKQQSLHSDVSLVIFIGDVSANDGIPFFVLPKIGQIANVTENEMPGSPVFQVIASDPDSPASASGSLFYKIQEGTSDAQAFRIDTLTGLITTLVSFDRETKDSYSVILEVSDNGEPPQSATRVLKINILDVDDHKPRFSRDIDENPMELLIAEEEPIGTVVGELQAIDEDIGENGAIDYMFIDGNQEDIFKITRTNDSRAIITTNKKIDRESVESFLVTIKCIKFGTNPIEISRSEYNNRDLSEIRVLIKVQDIDDHLPQFEQRDPTIGVRTNIPIDTLVITLKASDKDPEALPIIYSFKNITFVPQYSKRANLTSESLKDLFVLNNKTGEIRTRASLSNYVDGYFDVVVRANNSHKTKRHAFNKLKVFVIRDKSLLKFIFAKPPTEIRSIIPEFQKKVQKKIDPLDLELHVFDTQVLSKSDHSLDFSATSSCFQLFRHGSALPLHEMQKTMDSEDLRKTLLEIYAEFGVSQIDSCSVKRKLAASSLMSSPGIWIVILAILIGIAAIAATCTACCLAKKYKKHSKRLLTPRVPPEPYGAGAPVFYSEPIYGPL